MQEKLIKLRKVYNVRQKDLAEYLNITKRTYCNKEKGISQFTSDEMFALSKYFKKSLEEIFLPSTYQNGNKENRQSTKLNEIKLVYQTKLNKNLIKKGKENEKENNIEALGQGNSVIITRNDNNSTVVFCWSKIDPISKKYRSTYSCDRNEVRP